MRTFTLAPALLLAALLTPGVRAQSATPAAGQGSEPVVQSPQPPAAAAAFAEGKLLVIEGDLDRAEAAFDRALTLSKGRDAAYVLLEKAQLLERRARFSRDRAQRDDLLARAVDVLAEARRLAPENLDVLRTAGAVELDRAAAGDETAVAKAREAFEAVLAQDPTDAEAALTLSRIYLNEDQPGRAADTLRRLIDKVPQHRVAYSLLVEALLRAGRLRDAESTLAEMLGFDPASLQARLTLADLQLQRGDAKAAKATLLAAPKEAQEDPRLREALTRVREKQPD